MTNLLELAPFLKRLSELGVAKKHFLSAGREILLLIGSLLQVADNAVGETGDNVNAQTVKAVLTTVRHSLHNLAAQLPSGDDEKFQLLYRSVAETIVRVIEEEIRKTPASSAKTKAKKEALESIRIVLQKERKGSHVAAA